MMRLFVDIKVVCILTVLLYKLTMLIKCTCSRVPFLVKFSCRLLFHTSYWESTGAATVKVVENTYEEVYY